jgi:type II secretory pathway component PulJ
MTKEEELQKVMALLDEKIQKAGEREQARQEWLQHERQQAFKRNPGLLH